MRENLLILLARGLCGAKLGYAGDGQAKTPCLDALARESLLFSGALSPRPDRAAFLGAFLTGRRRADPPGDPAGSTFAAALGAAGYETGFFGPWTAGEAPGAEEETEQIAAFAERAARNGTPFAAFAAFSLPGDGTGKGIDPADLEVFSDVWLRQQPNFGKPGAGVLRPEPLRRRGEKRNRALRRVYAAASTLDRRAGAILRALAELGLERETVTVFTSDHGTLYGEHGAGGEDFWYAEAIRPPLLISQPMRLPAGTVSFPVETADLMPTLLGLCGAAIPESAEGRNLTPYLPGGVTGKPPAQTGAETRVPVEGRSGRWRGVATERYTLVRIGEKTHLYDRAADPYELNDLAGTPEGDELARRLSDGARG